MREQMVERTVYMKGSEVDQFAERVAGKLGLIFKALSLGLKKKLCQMKIGPPHMKVLFLLCSMEKEPTISRISKTLSISLAMMTRIIDRLEEKKLVQRISDPKDRRVIRIHITKKGRKLAHELKELRKKEIVRLMSSFNRKDRKKFMNSMDTVLEVLLRYEER
jgi:DNA-binding MarR family transcriptional regulator